MDWIMTGQDVETWNVRVIRPQGLSAEERAAWRDFLSTNPLLTSPYFTLGYIEAVAAVRSDVHVAVIAANNQIAGFLPFQRGVMGHARPVGGPISDCHGVICAPEARIDLDAVLRAARISVFDYKMAIADQPAFAVSQHRREDSWVIDMSAGFDAYLQDQRAQRGNQFRNIASAPRKLSKQGELTFRFSDPRAETFETLLAWKSAQYRASGHPDIFRFRWIVSALERLLEQRPEDGGGVLSSLEVDGRLVAVHFGLMGATALHYWFPAYDKALARARPGHALLMLLLEAARERGVTQVHLGPGDFSYKHALANAQLGLAEGCATTASPAALARQAAGWVESTAEALPLGPLSRLPGKAFRRIDLIAGLRAPGSHAA